MISNSSDKATVNCADFMKYFGKDFKEDLSKPIGAYLVFVSSLPCFSDLVLDCKDDLGTI